jgi:hypothetical protein
MLEVAESIEGDGPWKFVRFSTTTGDLGGIVAVPEADWFALSDNAHVIGTLRRDSHRRG